MTETLYSNKFFKDLVTMAHDGNYIPAEAYDDYDAKVGLRNNDGTGVLTGLTEIGEVKAYELGPNGERKPREGQLFYRGIEINELVKGYQQENRHGFEEVCYLLLFGKLPNKAELLDFQQLLSEQRSLPNGFTEDMILKAPSNSIMNKLARCVLTCYSYDDNPDDITLANTLRQCLELIARFPTMIAYAYQAKAHFYDDESLFIHHPQPELTASENFLHMVRNDQGYSKLEAEILDLNLILHAEHGGGNNSTFATRVVCSTGTDTYSAIAAAVGSLKGPKHGGANIKVMEMVADIKEHVKDWSNEAELEAYLTKIIRKEAFDRLGLIYGLGHAVYTLSDPRAILLKEKAKELAEEKNMEDEFELYNSIAKIGRKVFAQEKGDAKLVNPNVDFYSGFVYQMLNIPMDLYTPLFAMARISGWTAHRIEELVSHKKIIRPAYKTIAPHKPFISLAERG